MTVRAADDFGAIRARIAELCQEREEAERRRCRQCNHPYLTTHDHGCVFSGTVTESELA